MKPVFITTLCAAILAGGSAYGNERVQTVHFKPGKSFETISARIKGWDSVTYRLGARSGQVMSVLFSPSNGSCYFNVAEPGSRVAIFNGSVSGNEFARGLAASGDYRVDVYLMRNAARRGEVCNYSITFEISG